MIKNIVPPLLPENYPTSDYANRKITSYNE